MRSFSRLRVIPLLSASSLLALGAACADGAPSSSTEDSAVPPFTTMKGWEVTAANIGLAPLGLSCASLPAYTGSNRPESGAVISGKLISGGLDLSAGNITIERSCIRPTSVGRGMPLITTTDFDACNDAGCPIAQATVTIRDSEIDGSILNVESAAFTTAFVGIANIERSYIHHFGSGIGLMNTGPTLDAMIENNYVTDLIGFGDPATSGNHSDAFTVRDFDISMRPDRKLVVRGNRFDCDSVNATGAFFVQTYAGNIFNVRIEANLLEGDGYQLGLEDQQGNAYGNMVASNNRFSGTGYGPAYVTGGPGWETWQENYVANPASADFKGAEISEP